MQVLLYNPGKKEIWDNFVRDSRNGTFLHYRDFMEYHSDRFTDHSLLFYKNEELRAILPANLHGEVFYSHQGLTYGGLLLSQKVKSVEVVRIFERLIAYLKASNIRKIIYKTIPHIYHSYPSEEDLYALFRNNAVLESRNISSAIDLSIIPEYSKLRKRQIKKAGNSGLKVKETDIYSNFWEILEENLRLRYNRQPVHTLEEIERLHKNFPSHIRLFIVEYTGRQIAGCVVFETSKVAHIQYISSSEEGKEKGALDLLFHTLIKEVFIKKEYLDFGISTENQGHYLNEGLITQKEGFGGRGIVYDTYSISI